MARKNNFTFILLGIVVGITFTLGGGSVVYKLHRKAHQPKRYIVRSDPNERYALSNGSQLYVASSLDRIFKDGNTLLKPTFSKTVDLSAARNEYEAF